MRIRVELNIDNAAFEGDAAANEAIRVIGIALQGKARESVNGRKTGAHRLADDNGNTVGKLVVERDSWDSY